MGNNNDDRMYADLLDTTDVGYLSNEFDESEAFIRGMNDNEWCEYLGCTIDELPYHLFDDYFVPTIDDEIEAQYDQFDGESLLDIEDFLQKEFKKPAPKPVLSSTSLVHNYSRPSAFSTKKRVLNIPVPHHFELVR
jgi:hypothetical protein